MSVNAIKYLKFPNDIIDVLKSICKAGLPAGNIYEYAAQQVLNYEKKYKRNAAIKIANKSNINFLFLYKFSSRHLRRPQRKRRSLRKKST